jgi:hypothetical protein
VTRSVKRIKKTAARKGGEHGDEGSEMSDADAKRWHGEKYHDGERERSVQKAQRDKRELHMGGSRRGAKARDGIRERAWAYRTSGCAR